MAGMKGKLTVTVVECKELQDTELLGKMDPYVILEIGKEKHKTKVIKKGGRACRFDQSFIFNLEGKEDVLHINVMDEDLISDDHVGRVDIPLKSLSSQWYQLVDKNNFQKITGQLCLTVEFHGTGGPAAAAAAAAAPAKVAAPAPAAAAPAQVYMQPPQPVMMQQPQPVMMQQPQMVYAQPQPQMVYGQQPMMMAAPQPQLVRGTDGKLYAIQQPAQPQVVVMQQPRYM